MFEKFQKGCKQFKCDVTFTYDWLDNKQQEEN